jgi:hypothetical protein
VFLFFLSFGKPRTTGEVVISSPNGEQRITPADMPPLVDEELKLRQSPQMLAARPLIDPKVVISNHRQALIPGLQSAQEFRDPSKRCVRSHCAMQPSQRIVSDEAIRRVHFRLRHPDIVSPEEDDVRIKGKHVAEGLIDQLVPDPHSEMEVSKHSHAVSLELYGEASEGDVRANNLQILGIVS